MCDGSRNDADSSFFTELYTDESPGLKVDPVVVLVLSVGFIISVVALHGVFLIPHTHAFARGRNWRIDS